MKLTPDLTLAGIPKGDSTAPSGVQSEQPSLLSRLGSEYTEHYKDRLQDYQPITDVVTDALGVLGSTGIQNWPAHAMSGIDAVVDMTLGKVYKNEALRRGSSEEEATEKAKRLTDMTMFGLGLVGGIPTALSKQAGRKSLTALERQEGVFIRGGPMSSAKPEMREQLTKINNLIKQKRSLASANDPWNKPVVDDWTWVINSTDPDAVKIRERLGGFEVAGGVWRVVPDEMNKPQFKFYLEDSPKYLINNPKAKIAGKNNPIFGDVDNSNLARGDKAYKLEDVYNHEVLFNQEGLEDLRYIKVVTKELAPGHLGSYNHGLNTITISSRLTPEKRYATLIHELQHAVQNRHGMATGGSMEEYTSLSQKSLRDIDIGINNDIKALSNDDLTDAWNYHTSTLNYLKLHGEAEARLVENMAAAHVRALKKAGIPASEAKAIPAKHGAKLAQDARRADASQSYAYPYAMLKKISKEFVDRGINLEPDEITNLYAMGADAPILLTKGAMAVKLQRASKAKKTPKAYPIWASK